MVSDDVMYLMENKGNLEKNKEVNMSLYIKKR